MSNSYSWNILLTHLQSRLAVGKHLINVADVWETAGGNQRVKDKGQNREIQCYALIWKVMYISKSRIIKVLEPTRNKAEFFLYLSFLAWLLTAFQIVSCMYIYCISVYFNNWLNLRKRCLYFYVIITYIYIFHNKCRFCIIGAILFSLFLISMYVCVCVTYITNCIIIYITYIIIIVILIFI